MATSSTSSFFTSGSGFGPPSTTFSPVDPGVEKFDPFGDSSPMLLSPHLSGVSSTTSNKIFPKLLDVWTPEKNVRNVSHSILYHKTNDNGALLAGSGDVYGRKYLEKLEQTVPTQKRGDLDFITSFAKFFRKIRKRNELEEIEAWAKCGSTRKNRKLYFHIVSFLHVLDSIKADNAEISPKPKQSPVSPSLFDKKMKNEVMEQYMLNKRREFKVKAPQKKPKDLAGSVTSFRHMNLGEQKIFMRLVKLVKKGVLTNLSDYLQTLYHGEQYELANFTDVFKRLLGKLRRPLLLEDHITYLLDIFASGGSDADVSDAIRNIGYPRNYYFLNLITYFKGLHMNQAQLSAVATSLAPTIFHRKSEPRIKEVIYTIDLKVNLLTFLLGGFVQEVWQHKVPISFGRWRDQNAMVPALLAQSSRNLIDRAEPSTFKNAEVYVNDSSLEVKVKLMLGHPNQLYYKLWDEHDPFAIFTCVLTSLPMRLKPLFSETAFKNLKYLHQVTEKKRAEDPSKTVFVKSVLEQLSPSRLSSDFRNLPRSRLGVLSIVLDTMSSIVRSLPHEADVCNDFARLLGDLFFADFESSKNETLFLFLWSEWKKLKEDESTHRESAIKNVQSKAFNT